MDIHNLNDGSMIPPIHGCQIQTKYKYSLGLTYLEQVDTRIYVNYLIICNSLFVAGEIGKFVEMYLKVIFGKYIILEQ